MKNKKGEISVSDFKKHCLGLLEDVYQKHTSFVITKRGKPIAEVKPLSDSKKELESYAGCLKGVATIHGDIVNFSSEEDWKVLRDDYEFPKGDSE